MKKRINFIIYIFFLLFLTSLHVMTIPKLPQKYKTWLEQEVTYIITSQEEKTFKKLKTDKQRNLFIKEFWHQRDPTPGTPRNEFQEEHYRRVKYTNMRFTHSKPGWKSDRGRVYIILGEPLYRQQYTGQDIYPIELWFYQGSVSQGLESFFSVVFFKRYGSGDYELYSPLRDGPYKLCPATSHQVWDPQPEHRQMSQRQRYDAFFGGGSSKDMAMGGAAYEILYKVSVDLAQASLSLIPGGSSISPVESDKLLGNINKYPQSQVDDTYAYEFLRDKASVEVSYSVHYIGNISVVKVFQDESGHYFMHYSLQPQNLSLNAYEDRYYSNIKISGIITDSIGRTIFQYEREYPIELDKDQVKQVKLIPMAVQDSFPLTPGSYKISVLLQNMVSKEFTSFERDIIIPDDPKDFWMGGLLLAYMKRKDQTGFKNSFKIGEERYYPNLNREFTQRDTLYIFFQVHGMEEKLREAGWIKYTFFSGDKQYFERKKRIADYVHGKNFQEEFQLQGFSPAQYSLNVSVLDGDGKEVLLEEERFSVLTRIQTRPWLKFKSYPGSGDPVYSLLLGTQWLNKGEMGKAEEKLQEAYMLAPNREDFALAYCRVLLSRGAYNEVKEILNPYVERPILDSNLFSILGRAHQGAGEYEQAITCYQKYTSHEGVNFVVLNLIGECYFRIENFEEALRAWERSLEINPDQPEIMKKIDEIKK